MICEDCIFELGLEEYEYHRPNLRHRYRCRRCDEIVPSPRGNNIEEKLLEAMELKEKELKKHLPLSFVKLKRNCIHWDKSLHPGGGNCYFKQAKKIKSSQRYKKLSTPKKRHTKKPFYPDICHVTECPLLNS